MTKLTRIEEVKGNPENCRAEDKVLCRLCNFQCSECEVKSEEFRRERVAVAWNRVSTAYQLFPQPLDDKELEKAIYQVLIDNTDKRRERYGDIEVTHIDTNVGNSVEAILALLQPKIEEAIIQARKEQMVIDWAQAGKDVEEAKREIGLELFRRGAVGMEALPKGEQGFWKGYWQAYIDKGQALKGGES